MLSRMGVVAMILLSAARGFNADDPGKKEPAEPKWTLDLAKMKVPEAKVSGKIHGQEFTLDKAELENGILTLRQGKEFFPERAIQIFLFLKDGEKVEGKSYKIGAKRGFTNPHVHLQWKDKGKQVPDSEAFTDKYAMILEFGKEKDGAIPGKIYVSFPDRSKSFVAGTFKLGGSDAETAEADEIGGKILLRGSDKDLWLEVGCLGNNPKGEPEAPWVGFKLPASKTSATCTTWAPRNTTLTWDSKTGGTHKHTNRPAGYYLVFVRGKPGVKGNGLVETEGFYDWKWIELKEGKASVAVDLIIDPANQGTLEVQAPGAAKDASVAYLPLDTQGRLPLRNADPSTAGVASAKLDGGKAVIRGLREGKYQVAVGNTKADVEVKRGTTVKIELRSKK